MTTPRPRFIFTHPDQISCAQARDIQRGLEDYLGEKIAIIDGGAKLERIDGDLRDWFAGMALQGMLHKYALERHTGPPWIAGHAYEIADAMLAEREKQ